jgi:hypothetical protein
VNRARGELEHAVMTALWQQPRPVTGRTVLREIGDPDLAYTTVKTVLERLTRKQVVTRVNLDRTWHYAAADSREAYTAELMPRARHGDASGECSWTSACRSKRWPGDPAASEHRRWRCRRPGACAGCAT